MTTSSSNNANGAISTNSQSSTIVNISGNSFREPAIVSSPLPLSATIAVVPGTSTGATTSTVTSGAGGVQSSQANSTPEFQFLLPKIMEKLEKKTEEEEKGIERKKAEAADFCSKVFLDVINFPENPCRLAMEAIENLLEDERKEKEIQKREEIEKRREASKRRMAEKDKLKREQEEAASAAVIAEVTKAEENLLLDETLAISESSPDRVPSDTVAGRIAQSDIVDDLASMNLSTAPRERVPSSAKRTSVKAVRPKSQIKPSTTRQNSEAR